MVEREILREAVYAFGPGHQKMKAIEEMSELIKELCKDMDGKGNKDHIAEEIADVELTIEQLKIIYNNAKAVEEKRKEKTYRLNGLIFEAKYG